MILASLRMVVAQRLVKKVCRVCGCETTPDMEVLSQLQVDPDGGRFMEGAGCSDCGGTGYKGRVGLFEIMPVTDRIKAVAVRRADVDSVRAAAEEDGIVTLRAYGRGLVLSGKTTAQEVLRATFY